MISIRCNSTTTMHRQGRSLPVVCAAVKGAG